MEKLTLASVGNGNAVHIHTSTEFGDDYTENNTACGAVEYGGRGRSGSRLYNLGEGTVEQVTCKRCLKTYNSDAAREARENAAERAALAAGIEAGRPLIEDTVETPAEPESETITYVVTILDHTADRITARIIAHGMRTNGALARDLIVSRVIAKMRRNGASHADMSAERMRYMLTADVINDDYTTAPGISKRDYTLDTIDGAHSPIIKRADGTREVKVAGLETLVPAAATSRHLPAPHPATPPNPDLPVTPAGKLVEDVPFFDRSIKVHFKCPLHPAEVYMSKDPYVSSWFPGAPDVHGCPKDCTSKVGEHILVSNYRPTRRG